ncbi:MAG: hypothetical protein IJG65_10260 [Synergistaceae bacterium]|nr:hypothetical protein [Synergistaceae bacterium]
MEAARKKQSYVFDHKLTDAEIEELIENYDYDPKYLDPDYDDGGTELEPVWDRFGNPTEATIRALYEDRNDIGTGPMSMDEFDAWLDELREEEGIA